jgi:DNA-binding XRE family transcriptional regulator
MADSSTARPVNTGALIARRAELYGSRRAFCEAAGISLSYSKYIEAGTHQPSPRIARDLAAALQWDVGQLYAAESGQVAA